MIRTYFDRIKRMDELIRKKRTGCPDTFASKLGISKSTLMEYIKIMKELNCPISYDRYLESYYYEKNGKVVIEFMKLKTN